MVYSKSSKNIIYIDIYVVLLLTHEKLYGFHLLNESSSILTNGMLLFSPEIPR